MSDDDKMAIVRVEREVKAGCGVGAVLSDVVATVVSGKSSLPALVLPPGGPLIRRFHMMEFPLASDFPDAFAFEVFTSTLFISRNREWIFVAQGEIGSDAVVLTDDSTCLYEHDNCPVVGHINSDVVCKCECRQCTRAWFADKQPVVLDGKVVRYPWITGSKR